MSETNLDAGGRWRTAGRIVRHRLSDRLFHWITAITIFVLAGTAFLPIIGYRFGWVTIHWVAGIVLTVLVLFHIIRATFWQRLLSMMLGPRDIRDSWRVFRRVTGSSLPPYRQGKYSVAQKLMHAGVAVIVLALIITGLPMMAKIDNPFWQRNPAILSDYTWGWVYVVHGYAGMLILTVIIIHIYFGFRPEKLFFLRSMVRGWITGEEYRKTFDPARWRIDQKSMTARDDVLGRPAE